MKVGIVVFPGSNCDKDCFYATEKVLSKDIKYIWHDDEKINSDIDLIILPGGFSYGDYLRAGSIATFSHIMDQVKEFAAKGKLILGICNGFQVLTESHLLPGVLCKNDHLKFSCKDVFLTTKNTSTAFTNSLNADAAYQIPIANGEGRYFIDDEGLNDLKQNNQIIFRYCSKDGEISPKYNPNGSIENIAGISNKKGNVLGMMPHPERAIEKILGSSDGISIFKSILSYFE